MRGQEDITSPVLAGGMTGVSLRWRQPWPRKLRGSLFGATILFLIEVFAYSFQRPPNTYQAIPPPTRVTEAGWSEQRGWNERGLPEKD